jgi:hypothetical protein
MSKHNRDRRATRGGKLGPFAGSIITPVEEYHVGSWCPTDDGSGPATQVHFSMNTAHGPIVMRFKRYEDLDQFISILVRHRRDVWGDFAGR